MEAQLSRGQAAAVREAVCDVCGRMFCMHVGTQTDLSFDGMAMMNTR